MKEQSILHRILLACGTGSTRLFRQNVGTAWAGGKIEQIRRPTQVMCYTGDVVVRSAQPIRMGLCTGSSDVIGWTSRYVQPEDVGSKWAIFTALEVKSDTGRATKEQLHFIETVQAAGGIAGVVRSEDEAVRLLSGTPIK